MSGPRCYGGAKRFTRYNLHVLVDTDSGSLLAQIRIANVQDLDTTGPLDSAYRSRFPFVDLVFADASYRGSHAAQARLVSIEIVKGVRG